MIYTNFNDFINEKINNVEISKEEENEALELVQMLLMSSNAKNLPNLNKNQINFLKQTLKKGKTYKLYRGIGLIKDRVGGVDKLKEIAKSLKESENLPDNLKKVNFTNDYVSYSKKKGVAKDYAEGTISIIVQANVDSENILVDTSQLPNIISENQKIFDEDDFDYFKSEKEFIVHESNIQPQILKLDIEPFLLK